MVGCTRRLGKRAKVRFAEPPWNERSGEGQVRDQQVPPGHPAREVVEAMQELDLTPLFARYLGAGVPAIRPDLMLAVSQRLTEVELHAVNNRQDPKRRRKTENIVVSTSDPEAALGRDKYHVFRPLYNVQLVRDLDSQLCLSYQVFAQPTDAGTFGPMLERIATWTGVKPKAVLADREGTFHLGPRAKHVSLPGGPSDALDRPSEAAPERRTDQRGA